MGFNHDKIGVLFVSVKLLVALTGLSFFNAPSTVSLSATDGPICGIDIHDKSYWHEDDLMLYYCCKRAINYIFIGLRTWCGRLKSQQRGGKLMAPS